MHTQYMSTYVHTSISIYIHTHTYNIYHSPGMYNCTSVSVSAMSTVRCYSYYAVLLSIISLFVLSSLSLSLLLVTLVSVVRESDVVCVVLQRCTSYECTDHACLGCLAAWLPGCLAASLPRCLAAWPPRCLCACMHVVRVRFGVRGLTVVQMHFVT